MLPHSVSSPLALTSSTSLLNQPSASNFNDAVHEETLSDNVVGANARKATATSETATALTSATPSAATEASPISLPLITRPSSGKRGPGYNESYARDAFYRRLYEGLERVERQQLKHRIWIQPYVRARLASSDNLTERVRYTFPVTPPGERPLGQHLDPTDVKSPESPTDKHDHLDEAEDRKSLS